MIKRHNRALLSRLLRRPVVYSGKFPDNYLVHDLKGLTRELPENEPVTRAGRGRTQESLETINTYGKGVRIAIRRRPCPRPYSWVVAVDDVIGCMDDYYNSRED